MAAKGTWWQGIVSELVSSATTAAKNFVGRQTSTVKDFVGRQVSTVRDVAHPPAPTPAERAAPPSPATAIPWALVLGALVLVSFARRR